VAGADLVARTLAAVAVDPVAGTRALAVYSDNPEQVVEGSCLALELSIAVED
jgi:hypothetical protein